MTIQANTIRPGLLVSLKTSLRGNVQYDKVDLNEQHDGVQAKATWETTRTIADAVEYEAGVKARSKASALIRGVCTKSAFGLLCPEAQSWKLEDAVAEAHRVVDKFNETATLSRLHVYVIVGRVASDDVEAVRAINSEVRELMDAMTDGMQRLDVKAIRDAANKAREIGNMLTPEASVRIAVAIKTARDAASKIVAAGEVAATEVDAYAIRQITEARTAFLDLSDAPTMERPAAQARAIDLAPANGE